MITKWRAERISGRPLAVLWERIKAERDPPEAATSRSRAITKVARLEARHWITRDADVIITADREPRISPDTVTAIGYGDNEMILVPRTVLPVKTENLCSFLKPRVQTNTIYGSQTTIIDQWRHQRSRGRRQMLEEAERVMKVQNPISGRTVISPDNTIVRIDVEIGGDKIARAGPCSVESRNRCSASRRRSRPAKKNLFAAEFKLRTSPYAFQGRSRGPMHLKG